MHPINILRALQKLLEVYSVLATGMPEISNEEEEVETYLKEIILQCIESGSSYIEAVSNLVFDGTGGTDNIIYYERNDHEFNVEEEVDDPTGISQEKKNEVLDYWNATIGSKRKWRSMKSRYRFLKNVQQLYRWERQSRNVTRQQKYNLISDFTLERFKDAHVTNHRAVHDRDLRKWALQKAKEVNCVGFTASKFWLHCFKRKYRIVSRKIRKFVTKVKVCDKEEIENAAIAFQLENAPLVEQFGLANCLNADQSGFQLIMPGGRSLDFQGVKKVEIIAQSKNALTHSYTILPMMSASGKLLGPLYLVLQEPSGSFGPVVSQTMFRPNNVFISASKSGKMGAAHLDEWVKEVFVPYIGDDTLLFVNSWTTFTENNIRKMIPAVRIVVIEQIPPPGATGLIQQWDNFGSRFWKNMVRHIVDHVMLHDLPISMSQRNNIIRLQSLIYNQLSSPRYEGIFQYSWYKSGLVETRPPRFPNPVEYGFQQADVHCAVCEEEEEEIAMIRCSWCRVSLCASHFLTSYHFCVTYVE